MGAAFMVWMLCLLPGLAAALAPAGGRGDRVVLLAGAVSAAGLLIVLELWRRGRISTPGPAMIIAAAVSLRLLIWIGPVRFDDDLWRYLWDGLVTREGVSPYRFAPRDAVEYDARFDPLLLDGEAAGELARLAALLDHPEVAALVGKINFPHLPTIYPPTSQAAFAAVAWLAPGSERLWRLVTALADVAVVWLLVRLLGSLGRPRWWAAIYGLHPLPALEFAAAGHQDPLGIALLLAAAAALMLSRRALAGVWLAAASGVKLFPAVLAVAWIERLAVRGVAGFVAAAAALGIAAAAMGVPNLTGLGAYVGHWEFFSGPFAVLSSLASLLRLDAVLPAPGWGARGLLCILLAGMALASRFRRRRGGQETVERGLVWVEVLLILSPVVDPWYVPWGLAVGALRRSMAWPLLAACIPMAYFGYTTEGHPWWLRLLVWGPFLGLWIHELWSEGGSSGGNPLPGPAFRSCAGGTAR